MIIFTILLQVSIANCQTNPKEFPILKGPYFGQKDPGIRPELFADGTIANAYPGFHTSLVFTPDGNECYWNAKLPGPKWAIVFSRIDNGVWSSPEIAPFSNTEYRDDSPFISADGSRFYFISRRPLIAGEKLGKKNLWMMFRTGRGWSEPQALPLSINSLEGIHWQISVDKDFNLFFGICKDVYSFGRVGDIFWSEYKDGHYQKPMKLEEVINGHFYNACPYISPDGSYLMFAREDPLTQRTGIFISFKKEKSGWSEPINLSKALGDYNQTCPIITSDGKYLFFLRWVNSFCQPYWVSAKIIQELRPKN